MIQLKENKYTVIESEYEYNSYKEFQDHCSEMNHDGFHCTGYYISAHVWYASYRKEIEV